MIIIILLLQKLNAISIYIFFSLAKFYLLFISHQKQFKISNMFACLLWIRPEQQFKPWIVH